MSRFSVAAGRLCGFVACKGTARKRPTKRNDGILNYLRPLRFEPMEERALLSVTFTYQHTVLGEVGSNASAAVSTYYNPSQIKTAYGINSIAVNSITGDGTGQTIAIVDAYKDPNIATELAQFTSNFGLPTTTLTVVNQSGSASLSHVSYDAGWSQEIALDVEWAHAIAPGAKILLVEANSTSDSDLLTAVATAKNYTGVSVVSMSWGGDEYNGETSNDSYFTTTNGHTGVTFLAAAGDNGSPGLWPAYSSNVVAAGGTTLPINSNGSYGGETGWSDGGGGTSVYESKPSYQNAVNTTSHRQIPDVSFDADLNTGVLVYWIDNQTKQGAWYAFGGTSVASPCLAGLIAIVNQLRVSQGISTLNSPSNPTQTQTLLYSLPSGDFHDIVSGSNGGFSCAAGYDEVTGIGSPVANLLGVAMVQLSATPGTPNLSANYDTGQSNSDDITSLNNHNSGAALQFTIPNTVAGATVTVYADGTAIGSAIAAGTTTTITTLGNVTLADGSHAITARQTVSGLVLSAASSALTVTIDTTPPTVTINQAAGQTDPTGVSPINFSVVFSEPVWAFATGDVMLGGTALATAAIVTNPSNDHVNFNVAVSGMTRAGTVIANLTAGAADDTAGNASLASTSTDQTVAYVLNTAPVATVSFSTHTPLPDSVLTATATKADADGNPVSLTFVWTVNGTVERTFTSATALTDTFDLSQAGYGTPGNVIRVEVTPNDGFLNGATVNDTLTVPLPGDVNLDGQVTISDLTILLTNYGVTTGATWGTGDLNGDGAVGLSDLTILLTNYGASLAASAATQTSPGAAGNQAAVTTPSILAATDSPSIAHRPNPTLPQFPATLSQSTFFPILATAHDPILPSRLSDRGDPAWLDALNALSSSHQPLGRSDLFQRGVDAAMAEWSV